ncbi:MAG TPA: DJ-1 family protein [Opitutae bacterium]|nr:DJ-1 family protein [Opitutae bacterium]
MPLKALIVLHPGFEEIEAITPIDLLTRAGIDVVQASTGEDLFVKGRSGISIQASTHLRSVVEAPFDAVIIPGGPGIAKLRKDPMLCDLLKKQLDQGKLTACICAAPLLLKDAHLLTGRKYTAHFSTLEELPDAGAAVVVQDGTLLTSQGAGTATEFSLSLVENLCGPAIAGQIAKSICWPHSFNLDPSL